MLFSAKEIISIMRHLGKWIVSSTEDFVYQNPAFKPIEENNKGIAIYCIHGTADGNGSFLDVAKRLQTHLPTTIESVHLIHFDKRFRGVGIDDQSKQLAERITKNGHKKVILLGHSRGGLVNAYYAENFSKNQDVEILAVINICSPFKGSHLAYSFGLSRSIDQMKIGSEFLKKLTEQISESSIPYLYYSAQNDAIVYPHHAVPDIHKNKLTILDDHGHITVMTSHRLIKGISSHLRKLSNEEIEEGDHLTLKEHLLNLSTSIGYIILGIEMRKHLFRIDNKIHALRQLQRLIKEKDCQAYPTVGSFLTACLAIPTEVDSKYKIGDIMRQQLNPCSNFFNLFCTDSPPSSYKELCHLINKYNEIKIENDQANEVKLVSIVRN